MRRVLMLCWLFFSLVFVGCKSSSLQSTTVQAEVPKVISKTTNRKDMACLPGEVRIATPAQHKLEAALVKKKKLHQHLRVIAHVDFPKQAMHHISPQIEGTLVRTYVKVGQKVRKGQRLALIRSSMAGEARMKFLLARIVLSRSQRRVLRAKQLLRMGLGVKKNMSKAVLKLLQAKHQYELAQANLRIIGLVAPSKHGKLSHSSPFVVLRSTQAGTVAGIHKTMGDWVHGKEPTVTVVQDEKLLVSLQLPLKNLPFVGKGTKVQLPCLTSGSVIGRLGGFALRANPRNQSIQGWSILKAPPLCLKAGQILEALLYVSNSGMEEKVVVPESSLQSLGQQKVVFVKTKRMGCFQVRSVIPAFSFRGETVVLFGLHVGEKVVHKGSFYLKSELLREQIESE